MTNIFENIQELAYLKAFFFLLFIFVVELYLQEVYSPSTLTPVEVERINANKHFNMWEDRGLFLPSIAHDSVAHDSVVHDSIAQDDDPVTRPPRFLSPERRQGILKEASPDHGEQPAVITHGFLLSPSPRALAIAATNSGTSSMTASSQGAGSSTHTRRKSSRLRNLFKAVHFSSNNKVYSIERVPGLETETETEAEAEPHTRVGCCCPKGCFGTKLPD